MTELRGFQPDDAIEVTVKGTLRGKPFTYRSTGRAGVVNIENDWVEVPSDEPWLGPPRRHELRGVRLSVYVTEPKVEAMNLLRVLPPDELPEDELPEQVSPWGDAPRWYWRIAFHLHGWKREVGFWALLALAGFALGLTLGVMA